MAEIATKIRVEYHKLEDYLFNSRNSIYEYNFRYFKGYHDSDSWSYPHWNISLPIYFIRYGLDIRFIWYMRKEDKIAWSNITSPWYFGIQRVKLKKVIKTITYVI
jgi:hypothetical protein